MKDKSLNPLHGLTSTTIYHVLIAFEFSEDAYTSTIEGSTLPANGIVFNASTIKGTAGGKAIAVINEAYDNSSSLVSAESSWRFFSQNNPKTTSYAGNMLIKDVSGFLFTQLLKDITATLDLSLHHLTFAWVPVFVGGTHKSTVERTVRPNPLYFHVTRLIQSFDNLVGRSYILNFVSCYNTYGTGPQFATMYQNTITHKLSNNANIVPINSVFNLGIVSVKDEDNDKLKKRQARLNSVKYMTTVGDFSSSFEYSLNNQKFSHRTQLQEFLGIIKDSHAKRIKPLKQGDALPIEYKITCSPYYLNKKLDNRNLPYEQVEMDQSISGISSMTFPLGYSIHQALSRLMTMSKDVGNDHTGKGIKTFKFTTSTNRTAEGKYVINTKINDYTAAYTSSTHNTGPGNNLIQNRAIELSYQDKDSNYTDIISLSYTSGPQFSLTSVERADDSPDSQVTLGDRESISSARVRDNLKYFNNSFSGVNVSRSMQNNIGLQNSEYASAISNFTEEQQISYTIYLHGNPSLLSDLNRNPLDVMKTNDAEDIGIYTIYSNVEYEPMYMKLKIYLDDENSKGKKVQTHKSNKKKPPPNYYYDNYLHITRVDNVFVGGRFTQYIYCGRTDENA